MSRTEEMRLGLPRIEGPHRAQMTDRMGQLTSEIAVIEEKVKPLKKWMADTEPKVLHPRRHKLKRGELADLHNDRSGRAKEIDALEDQVKGKRREAISLELQLVAGDPSRSVEQRMAAETEFLDRRLVKKQSEKEFKEANARYAKGKELAKEAMLRSGATEDEASALQAYVWSDYRSYGNWWADPSRGRSLDDVAKSVRTRADERAEQIKAEDERRSKIETEDQARKTAESERRSAIPLHDLDSIRPSPTKVVPDVDRSVLTDLGDAWWTDGKMLFNTEGTKRIGPIVKRMREGLAAKKAAGKTQATLANILEVIKAKPMAATTVVGVEPELQAKGGVPILWMDADGKAVAANAWQVATIQRGINPDRWTTTIEADSRKGRIILAWKGDQVAAMMGDVGLGANVPVPAVDELRRRAAMPKTTAPELPAEGKEEPPKAEPTAQFGGIPLNIPPPGLPPKAPKDEGPSPEISRAIGAAKTLPKVGPTLWEQTVEVAKLFKPGHPHPSLDRTKKLHAAIENLLNLGIGARRTGSTLATEKILEHLAPLNHVEKAQFEEILVIRDIKGMLDREMYDPETLIPFTDLTSEDAAPKIAERLDWLERTVDPKVMAAIEQRRAYVRNVAEQFVALKELPPEVLKNEDYYHHLVLSAWAEAKAEKRSGSGGAMSAELRTVKAGFQRARTSNSLTYLTEYAQAEFDWLSAALSTIATRHVQDRVEALADRRKQITEQMKEANWVDAVGGQANANRIVELRQKIDAIHADNTDPATGRRHLDSAAKAALRILHEELDALDFTTGIVQRMAISAATMTKAAQNDELPPDDGQWRVAKDELSAGDMDLAYVGWLAEQEGDFKAIRAARGWFKAMAEKEKAIKAHVALHEKKYRNWRSEKAVEAAAKKAGLVGWQPKEGNLWFRGEVIPESKLLDAIRESGLIPEGTSPELVMAEMAKIREGLLMGGRRQTWYVEPAIAKALDDMKDVSPKGVGAKAWQGFVKGIRYMLLFVREFPLGPLTYLKNNVVGNITKTLAAGMDAHRIYGELLPAITDLLKYKNKTADPKLIAEMEGWIKNGLAIAGSGVSDVDQLRDVMRIVRRTHNAILMDAKTPTLTRLSTLLMSLGKALLAAGPEVAGVTDEMFRLAAARARRKLGRGIWQSSARQVDAETDPQRKAVLVANDLYGNYATTSRATSFFSRWGFLSFPRWTETNLYGYMQGLRNSVRDAKDAGRRSDDPRAQALAGTRLAINAAITYGALWAFSASLNELMIRSLWDDDDDRKRMRRAIRWGSIIIGKTKAGDAKIMPILGTWEDVLSWVGLQDAPDKVRAIAAGQKMVGSTAADMAAAPFSKVANMAMPPLKSGFESLFGRSLYPDVSSHRAIRDPVDLALSGWGLSQPYRIILEAMTGLKRPTAGQKEGDTNQPGKEFGGFTSGADLPGLTRVVDPYAASYWALRKMEWDWMDRMGEGRPPSGGTPLFSYLRGHADRSMALWFYRTAK
ncbi:MAG: hypothetical protein KKF27_21385, partial [Gammaproteobacteria bacterium]|nr:hypothetical protein [Gammaproteobacteria bacterium]